MVFVETSLFTRHVGRHLPDAEYRLLQKFLLERPDAGSVIRASGGIRKIRWAAGSQGKSGGVRIIYYWMKSKDQIFLLTIYGKSSKDDLDADDLKRIKEHLEAIENG
jgi:mRNA-degrading endonuclease RelE of RelBE toxin-antitoxin system